MIERARIYIGAVLVGLAAAITPSRLAAASLRELADEIDRLEDERREPKE